MQVHQPNYNIGCNRTRSCCSPVASKVVIKLSWSCCGPVATKVVIKLSSVQFVEARRLTKKNRLLNSVYPETLCTDFVRFRVLLTCGLPGIKRLTSETQLERFLCAHQRTVLSRFPLLQAQFFRLPAAQLISLMSASASAKPKLPCLTEVTAWPRSPPPPALSSLTLAAALARACNGAEKLFSFSASLLHL